MAIYGSLGEINVAGITSTTADNAVDVFVYDTRKDSDGGSWRKRTQHTSWYNETLNTATRGSRRDFPAVAVLVLTSTKVTIYDGDDPDLPMWMDFTISFSNYYQGSGILGGVYGTASENKTPTAIFMMNGQMWMSRLGTYAGVPDYGAVVFVDFLQDLGGALSNGFANGVTVKNPTFLGNIAQRNSSSFSGHGQYKYWSNGIINSQCNDVAMTVLPNAPIDPSTGLPVPTIAVATAGGVSIIRDNGTVENTDVANIIKLGFVKNDRLAYGHRSGYAYQGIVLDIAPFRNSATYGWYVNQTAPSFGGYTLSDVPGAVEGVGDGNVYAWSGSTGGIRRISENTSSPTNGMVNYITTSYNTGWMHGDIKGAWLSDTSTASVTGTELITNGDGTTTTGWTAGGGNTLTIDNGRFKCTTNINDGAYFGQGISVVIGRTYAIQATIVSDGTSKSVRMYLGGSVGSSGYAINQEGYVLGGVATIYWTATFTGTAFLWFYGSVASSGTYILVDNVSARIAELDRSMNEKGLAVYGTITKSAVATGADLVGYSGFSVSNYLMQPYNSALDFGTGDFCVMGWVKKNGNSNKMFIDNRKNGNNAGFSVESNTNGTVRLRTRNTTAESLTSTTRIIGDNNWHHIAASVSSSGTNHRIYIDGVLDVNSIVTPYSVSTGGNELYFGIAGGFGSIPLDDGSLALWRVSASAPSPEQILKIYNDEKALFQENSKAVLFGSSSAVTALAYDDTTKLLHVGTSSGRSDFQGLERINNTTTAVTTAISASNGLIAEQ